MSGGSARIARTDSGCTAVSLEGWGDPDLSVTAVGDQWHLWYLAEDGDLSFCSVGDESAGGTTKIIFSNFYDIPNTELIPAAVAMVAIREWFENKQLSTAVQWVAR